MSPLDRERAADCLTTLAREVRAMRRRANRLGIRRVHGGEQSDGSHCRVQLIPIESNRFSLTQYKGTAATP